MQSDIDAQLTSFFEEAPPREFVTVMRVGMRRHQVDEDGNCVTASHAQGADCILAYIQIGISP